MKFTLTTRLAAATGVTAVLLGGLVPPVAQADPIPASPALSFGELSGTGSDTTQDVMNGISVALGRAANGLWKLASYDATWSADATPATSGTIQTKSDGNTAIGRPNGSGDGLESLSVSIGQTATHTGTRFGGAASTWASDGGVNDVIGDIQFSRSSSGPTIVADGVVSYVPFAKDAVGYAISANSVMPALTVGSSSDAANVGGVTPSSLWAIYNCSATRIITKTGVTTKLVNNSYTLQAGESSTRIRAYLPQSSSGTAKFWQGATGAKFANPTPANLFNCVERKKFVAGDAGDVSGGDNTFTSGADYTGIEVQEHSGLAVQNDPGAITPFSIPNWVAMSKGLPGVTDRRYGAVLGVLNGVNPTSTIAGGILTLNPAFLTNQYTSYVTRTVYNVVPYRLVTDPSTLEYKMFKGRTSLVCSKSTVISNYGYGLLTATSGVNSCGDTSQRALAPSTPTVSGATGVADNANSEYDFEVTGFVSNGTAGAKVYVVATSTTSPVVTYTANSATPATIAAGATGTTFSLPYSAVRTGSWKLGLQVVPNLPGIASVVKDNSGAGLVTRTTGTTTTTATVAAGKANVAGSAVVRVTASAGTPTGTVAVYKGTSATGSSIATGILVSGAVTITLPAQVTKGKVPLFFVYSGDATNGASTKAVTWVIK